MDMLALQITNEAIVAGSFVIALIVAVVISLIVYFVLRRELNSLKTQFNNTVSGQFKQITDDLSNRKHLPF